MKNIAFYSVFVTILFFSCIENPEPSLWYMKSAYFENEMNYDSLAHELILLRFCGDSLELEAPKFRFHSPKVVFELRALSPDSFAGIGSNGDTIYLNYSDTCVHAGSRNPMRHSLFYPAPNTEVEKGLNFRGEWQFSCDDISLEIEFANDSLALIKRLDGPPEVLPLIYFIDQLHGVTILEFREHALEPFMLLTSHDGSYEFFSSQTLSTWQLSPIEDTLLFQSLK